MAAVRTLGSFALLLAGAVSLGGAPSDASAKNRFALEPPNVEQKRAYRYASTSNEDCLKELDKRKFPYALEPATQQVDLPLRFSGPVRGVTYKLTQRAEKNPEKTSPSAVADCRLALAIDDLSRILEKHDIVEVEYLSMYRKRGVGFVKPGKRHPSGRAIDIATLKRKDGEVFSVYKDWHGRVGSETCGLGAAKPTKDTDGAKLMRAIVCETAAIGPFNLMLTPHYDWGHKDHFHFEVRSDIRWFLIQ
ncbi:MAG: extensin family protein [Polyangiaceae bacterium]|nr:extensin family protein [Polyangiaceae bacterium]